MNRIGVLCCLSLLGCLLQAQQVDPQLMTYIDSIKAIDNHAHVVAPDIARDTGYDALRCETLPAATALPPANVRFGPEQQATWKALYGLAADSDSPDNLKKVEAGQKSAREQQGSGYFDWVLQQAGFEAVLANRVSMAKELDAKHFLWVPYDDALLFPLNNSALAAENPDRKVLFAAEDALLKSYVPAPAPTLGAYLENVDRILNSQKEGGAVAIKFEVAYLRSLDFEPPSRSDPENVYAKYASGIIPTAHDYKTIQDFLFRYIAQRAGELGLAVHIHTGSGCGEYFDDRGSDPMLLDSVLNDPALRKTAFVLLHGGSPFDRHNVALIVKPNVYVDTSVLELIQSPAEMARTLRPWLETMPEHVLFGTDAGPFGPGYGWEETTYAGSRRARRALGVALSQMIAERVISLDRAKQIAEMVLRKNAAELYRIH